MVNRKKIKELKKVALSQSQLQSNTTKQIPILTYDEIYGKSLDRLTRHGGCILLYLIDESYGHWTTLVRVSKENEPDHLIYFDSYGEYPDQPLMWSSSVNRRVFAQTHFEPLKNQSNPKRSKVNHFEKVK